MNNADTRKIPRWSLMALFTMAAMALAAGGYGFHRHEAQAIRTDKLNDLKAIAELKCNQIVAWREERLTDARTNASGIIQESVLKWLKAADDAGLKTAVLSRLSLFRHNENYQNIILATHDGRLLLSADPKLTQLEAEAKELVAQAVSSRQAVFGEFYRCLACEQVHLDVAAPILDEAQRPVAVLILRSDPEKQLYPLIQSWPLPSRSAETLLLRRDGGDALFLNVLRHRPDPALSLRIPLSRTDVPVVQAALGKTGEFEGLDYRGVAVLADLRPVPGSLWSMVAKADADEILAEARTRGGMILLLVALGVLMTGGLAAFLFNYRSKNIYKALFRAEQERRKAQEETRATLYGIGDGVIATDAAGQVTRMNPVAESLTGWIEAEALGRPIHEVFRIVNEETRAEVENPVDLVLCEGHIVGLANHTRLIARDGTERPIADSGAPIQNEDGAILGVVLVFRDQSAERAAQRALQESERFARSTVDALSAHLAILDETGSIIAVNRAWRHFAELNAPSPDNLSEGANYLSVCDAAHGSDSEGAAEFAAGIRAVMRGEKDEYTLEYPCHAPDEKRWFVGRVTRFPGEGVTRLVVAHETITAQRKSEQNYQMLFREMLDGFALHEIICDAQGRPVDYRFLAVNPAFERLTGLNTEALLGKTVRQVMPSIEAHWIDTYGQVALNGEPAFFENYSRELGRHYQVTVFSPAAGQFACIFADITHRKQAEEELLRSEEKFRRIVESAPMAMHFYKLEQDGNLVLTGVNPAADRTLGIAHQALVGQPIEAAFPPLAATEIPALYHKVARGETGAQAFEIPYQDGRFSGVYEVQVFQTEPGVIAVSFVDITVRKRAEDALRESEEQYRLLFNSIHDAVFLHGFSTADGMPTHFLQVNDVACQRYGYSREEWLCMLPQDLDAPEGLAAIPGVIRQLQTQGHATWEGMHRAKDGRRVPVEISNVLFDYRGAPVILSTVRDITQRKQSEALLLREQGLYKDLVNTIPAGTYRLRMKPATGWNGNSEKTQMESQYTIDMVSDRFSEITGISRQEFEANAQCVLGRIHPDDIPEFARRNAEVVESMSLFRWEGRMVLPDQRTIWVQLESIPRRLDNGEVMWTGIVYDITERKQAVETLRESEERFRNLLQNVECIAVQGYSPDGTTQYWNQASEQLYGYPAQEAIGRNLLDLIIPHEMRDGVTGAMRQMAETGQAIPAAEISLMRKDGSRIAVFSSHTIVQVPGRPQELFCIDIDLTERKRAEEEREKLQAQLLQAQKMESVGRLAGGVAHDFNNMLGVIMGHADMALEQIDPEAPLHDDLKEIQKAALRSADLTRQLLAFARKQTVSPKILDINETVASMLKMLQRLIGEDIELAWNPGPELWPIKMDPSQMDQILANLAVNARDAIAGVGHLTIQTENVVFDESYCRTHDSFTPGDYVMLAVSDTGAGMDKETLERVFEPFFTTKEVGKGTGLGLAMVYGAVKQNRGFINVYSEPGQGTAFKIYLPRAEAAQVARTATREKPAHGTETVLLAEDEEAILKLGTAILKKHGYTVLAARTPEEALALAEGYAGPIQLLITDVVMPGMNGKELKDRLTALRPGIKVLFMSGYTSDIIAHQGVIDEGVEFLQKPFSVNTLAQKVREVLQ